MDKYLKRFSDTTTTNARKKIRADASTLATHSNASNVTDDGVELEELESKNIRTNSKK